MFWYGEASRTRGYDWRPEIHDSDGLAIRTGADERIWRPLNNPPRVTTNTFIDRDVKGFGLLQRDRDFVHYLDDGVFYERRPSVWVEPLDPWGEGAVHLLEIPTDDETQDNVAAYWCPTEPFRAGERRRYRYRLSWLDDIPFPATLGRATATWTGRGGRPGFKPPDGTRKFVIDFQGPVFAGLGRNDGVEIVVTPSRGTISNAYTHPVVDQRERWRALFDLDVTGPEPVDLRAYLKLGWPRADRDLDLSALSRRVGPTGLLGCTLQVGQIGSTGIRTLRPVLCANVASSSVMNGQASVLRRASSSSASVPCREVLPARLVGEASRLEGAIEGGRAAGPEADDVNGQLLARRLERAGQAARVAAARLLAVGQKHDLGGLVAETSAPRRPGARSSSAASVPRGRRHRPRP